jgi:hypothetical protein
MTAQKELILAHVNKGFGKRVHGSEIAFQLIRVLFWAAGSGGQRELAKSLGLDPLCRDGRSVETGQNAMGNDDAEPGLSMENMRSRMREEGRRANDMRGNDPIKRDWHDSGTKLPS